MVSVVTTFSDEAAAAENEAEELLLVVLVMLVMLDVCSIEVCFKCLAIWASADSEKRMLFSTATLTTLTEGSGLALLPLLELLHGAALVVVVEEDDFSAAVAVLVSEKVSPMVLEGVLLATLT